jgi:hypothetical protein
MSQPWQQFENMRILSGREHQLFQLRAWVGLALATGALVVGGCSKAKTQAPAAETPAPTATVNQATNVTANGQADMGEINRAMLRWIVGHKRVPANFEEFAASPGVTIPPPPPGKKYIVAKSMHVELVDK